MSAPTPASTNPLPNVPEEARPEVPVSATPYPSPSSPISPTSPYGPYSTPHAPPPMPTPPKRRASNTGVIIAVVAAVVLIPVVACIGAALLAGGLGLFVRSSQVEQTAASQFQLAVSNHPTIAVSDTAGTVTITRGAVQQVTVVATKRARAGSSQAAQNLLKNMSAEAVATTDGARITATTGPSSALSQRTVDLRITVPETSDLTVTLTAGTLSINGITGIVNVTGSAGTFDLRDMTAQGASQVTLSSGTLTFAGELAKDARMTVTINAGTANVRLPTTSATHFDAATRVGSISVSSWSPAITHSGAGQSTTFDLIPSPTSTLTVRVDVGSITLGAR